ncbi:MAG: hypothetical protein AAF790_15260, partial [Planctomycetota bacterium]
MLRRRRLGFGRLGFAGYFAWLVWLVVHVFFLTGFRNRLFVVMSWAWSFFTFRRGARLIVGKDWREPADAHAAAGKAPAAPSADAEPAQAQPAEAQSAEAQPAEAQPA